MHRRSKRRWRGFDRLIAAIVTGAFIAAPFPASTQPSGSSSSDSKSSNRAQGPTPKVFLLPTTSIEDEISDLVPQRIGEMLRKKVGPDGRVELLPTYREMRQTKGEGSGSGSAAITKARKKYTSGIGLLNAGDFEKASNALQAAVDLIKDNIESLREYDVLADALAKLARAYFESGYNFDARKRMTEYAHLRPDATLDPDEYPEKLRELHERETRKIEKAGPGKIVVNSDAEQAEVWIDGNKKGTAPVTLSDVTYGYHYLVVKGPRGRAWSKQIQVRGRGKKQTFQATLEGASKAKASNTKEKLSFPAFYTQLRDALGDGTFEAEALAPYVEELAKRTNGGYAGWVLMYREEGRYVAAPFVYHNADGRLLQLEETHFNIQLSNLRVGVSELSTTLVEAVLEMPESKAVSSVQLLEPKEERASAGAVAATGQSSGSTTSTTSTTPTTPSTAATGSPTPPPEPADDEGGAGVWLYVGVGGAVLAVGGLVAGGFALFGGGERARPPGFNANVSW